jgi:hypothetical protein
MNRHNMDRIEEVLRSNVIESAPSVLSSSILQRFSGPSSRHGRSDGGAQPGRGALHGDRDLIKGASMASYPGGSRSPSRPLRRAGSRTRRIPSAGSRWTASTPRISLAQCVILDRLGQSPLQPLSAQRPVPNALIRAISIGRTLRNSVCQHAAAHGVMSP